MIIIMTMTTNTTIIKSLRSDKIKFKHEPSKLVEICNLLGAKYRECGQYDDAVDEHRNAIDACGRIKNVIISRESEAISRRALGECLSEMGHYQEAEDEHERYLVLALMLNEPIEIQRAHATIGRTYLLWAMDECVSTAVGPIQRTRLAKSAASFNSALQQCERLMSSGKLKCREYADMKSRLLLNLGLVYENLNELEKCKQFLFDSITLTKANFLFDELFRCQIALGSIYEKMNFLSQATETYQESLQTALQLKSRTKKCEALMALGTVAIKCEQFEQAKRYFKKAYFAKSPIQEDRQKVERLLKIIYVLLVDLQKLTKTASSSDEMIQLYDRLGDHCVELKCYALAVKYYKQELYHATSASKPDSLLSKIYVSIGQTYSDDGQYEQAIDYFMREYRLMSGEDKIEQCTSLLKIADLQESYYQTIDDLECEKRSELLNTICVNYRNAIQLLADSVEKLIHSSQEVSGHDDDGGGCGNINQNSKGSQTSHNSLTNGLSNDIDQQCNAIPANARKELSLYGESLKNFLHFLAAHKLRLDEQNELQNKIVQLNDFLTKSDLHSAIAEQEDHDDDDDDDDDDVIAMNDNEQLYDSYNLDLLSSDSDTANGEAASEDEEVPDNYRTGGGGGGGGRGKRNPNAAKLARLNQFGETPLHTACIAGNLAQVERLIEQKAPLNTKDYCGWTPLHEAANHGHLEVVRCLLKAGANIEATDERSELITPLHDACNCGHLHIIKLLLSEGSNLLAVSARNETPVECLMSWRQRSEHELTQAELESCLELEKEMLTTMQAKGFDLDSFRHKLNKSNLLLSDSQNKRTNERQVCKRNLSKLLHLSSDDDEDDDDKNDDAHRSSSSSNTKIKLVKGRLDYDQPGAASSEYQKTMDTLRRTRVASRLAKLDSRQPPERAALISENEVAPRDDWLINDIAYRDNVGGVGIGCFATKKRNKEPHYEVRSARKRRKGSNDGRERGGGGVRGGREKSSSDRIWDTTVSIGRGGGGVGPERQPLNGNDDGGGGGGGDDDDDDDRFISGDSSASENETYQNDIFNSNVEFSTNRFDRHNFDKSSKEKRLELTTTKVVDSDKNSHEFQQSSLAEFDSSNEFHNLKENNKTNVNKWPAVAAAPSAPPIASSGKVLVQVRFDDIERSCFAIPITVNNTDCRSLIEQLTKRYFRKNGVKPVISLRTIDGALLSDEDQVMDVIQSSNQKDCVLQAVIDSYTTEPASKRYIELCQENGIQPNDELMQRFRMCSTGGLFKLSQVYCCSTRLSKVIFQSLFRQELKEINLSFTSLLCNSDSMQCFVRTLATLPTLQVLNLSGTALAKRHLLALHNLSPVLKHLDLSFNSIGDESCFALAQIIKLYDKLRCLSLRGCSLTSAAMRNKTLVEAIECSSSLASLELDYNRHIDSTIVTKCKQLMVDKTFLRNL